MFDRDAAPCPEGGRWPRLSAAWRGEHRHAWHEPGCAGGPSRAGSCRPAHDRAEADHARRLLNLERPTAEALFLLLRATGRHRVLEVGTSNGISAMWIASALRDLPDALPLVTLERDAGRHAQAVRNLCRAGLSEGVQPLLGDATGLIATLPGPFDCVFFDADRVSAPAQLALLLEEPLRHATARACIRRTAKGLAGSLGRAEARHVSREALFQGRVWSPTAGDRITHHRAGSRKASLILSELLNHPPLDVCLHGLEEARDAVRPRALRLELAGQERRAAAQREGDVRVVPGVAAEPVEESRSRDVAPGLEELRAATQPCEVFHGGHVGPEVVGIRGLLRKLGRGCSASSEQDGNDQACYSRR